MNRNNPKVTVRMSAYNHETYVEQAILSIVNQTFQDFELNVIDDGSSDRTPEILERLSRKYGFYYERQENMGLTPTLNKLNRMAKGEYLTGCASDDYWPLTRLEEQVEALEKHPDIAFVHGIPALVDDQGTVFKERRFSLEKMLDGPTAFYDLIHLRKTFQTTTHMMRRSVWEALGGYDERISVEDIDWMLRVTRNYNIKALGKVWVYYRRHDTNWTITKAGASKLIYSECQVAKKLGVRDGFSFLFARVSNWLELCNRSGSRKRYLCLILAAFYFWHRGYMRQFVLTVLGEERTEKLIVFRRRRREGYSNE